MLSGVGKILEEKKKRKEAKIKRKLLRDTFRFPLKVPEDSGEEEDPKISHPLERIYQNSDHPIVVRSHTSTTKLGTEARQFTQVMDANTISESCSVDNSEAQNARWKQRVRNLSLVAHLFNGVSSYSSKLALVDANSSETVSYAQLKSLILKLSHALLKISIRKNNVVLFLSPNDICYIIYFLAVISIGAILSTVNPAYTNVEIAKQITNCDPKLVGDYRHDQGRGSLS
ncbi:hypothetical protein VNO77_44243 [Canavalia gladiata]|uniref:AMP-dependent synthetase/ligase domain-containing protein n=1 Tax=Canavalia gladiata TaxID=3824 RepID=A0AAN9JXU8_CANGL